MDKDSSLLTTGLGGRATHRSIPKDKRRRGQASKDDPETSPQRSDPTANGVTSVVLVKIGEDRERERELGAKQMRIK